MAGKYHSSCVPAPASGSRSHPPACCYLQGKPTTREWDLNRPDAKKLDAPARLGDDDVRCGPASLQRFAGEDLTVRQGMAGREEGSTI